MFSTTATLPNLPLALGAGGAALLLTFSGLLTPITPDSSQLPAPGTPGVHVVRDGGSRPLPLRPDRWSFQAPFDNEPPLPTIPHFSGL